MTHDDLALDLAGHLRADRRMVWADLQLGPSGSPRPDVYALFKSYTNPAPMSYEVKVSKADFRADVTSGKWQSYLSFSSGVYFAVAVDLGIGKAEVPEHCGLLVRGPKGWRAAKRPILSPVQIPQDVLLKLLIDGVEREGPTARLKSYGQEHVWLEKIRRRFGDSVATTVQNLEAAKHRVANSEVRAEQVMDSARREADMIHRQAKECSAENVGPERRLLTESLDLPADADLWAIRAEINRILRIAKEPSPGHRQLTEAMQRVLDNHGFRAPAEAGVTE